MTDGRNDDKWFGGERKETKAMSLNDLETRKLVRRMDGKRDKDNIDDEEKLCNGSRSLIYVWMVNSKSRVGNDQ